MIYPDNFEFKIGFHEIRDMLRSRCLSPLGIVRIDNMAFMTDADAINASMEQIREMKRIRSGEEDFPLNAFFDVRESMKRLRMTGTFLEETELFELMRTLATMNDVVAFLKRYTDDEHSAFIFPALAALTEGVIPMPQIVKDIDRILDKFGHIKDNASPKLAEIRHELARTKGSISRILGGILRSAQSEGLVDKDVAPTLRDGRLVLPVAPGLKRKIGGIVHDESASGRTVYVEPAEVVEANNHIRELESDERHEIIRILKQMADDIRPHTEEILFSQDFLADIDFVHAKASLSESMQCAEPQVTATPIIDWTRARHPLLEQRLKRMTRSDRMHVGRAQERDAAEAFGQVDGGEHGHVRIPRLKTKKRLLRMWLERQAGLGGLRKEGVDKRLDHDGDRVVEAEHANDPGHLLRAERAVLEEAAHFLEHAPRLRGHLMGARRRSEPLPEPNVEGVAEDSSCGGELTACLRKAD